MATPGTAQTRGERIAFKGIPSEPVICATILLSFFAGMLVTLGVRHGTFGPDQILFLVVGCLSLASSIFSGLRLVRRTNH
jgi:hypothetical protein